MRSRYRFGPLLLALSVAAGLPQTVFAAEPTCPFSFLPCAVTPGNLINKILFDENGLVGQSGHAGIFAYLLGAMILFMAAKLLLQSSNESVLGEVGVSIFHMLVGTCIVTGAVALASAFGQVGITSAPNTSAVSSAIRVISDWLLVLLSIAVEVNLVIAGFRLVSAQDDAAVDLSRKRVIHGFIGAIIANLAVPFVHAIFGGSTSELLDEVVGLGTVVVTIFGALAVLALVIAGIMLIVSVDEGLKDRARTLVTASLVSLIVVMTSYGILYAFASASVQ